MGCFSKRRASISSNRKDLVPWMKDLMNLTLDRIQTVTGIRPKKRPAQVEYVTGDKNRSGNYEIHGTNAAAQHVSSSGIRVAQGPNGEQSRELAEILIHEFAHLYVTLGAKVIGGEGRYTVSHPAAFKNSFLRWRD